MLIFQLPRASQNLLKPPLAQGQFFPVPPACKHHPEKHSSFNRKLVSCHPELPPPFQRVDDLARKTPEKLVNLNPNQEGTGQLLSKFCCISKLHGSIVKMWSDSNQQGEGTQEASSAQKTFQICGQKRKGIERVSKSVFSTAELLHGKESIWYECRNSLAQTFGRHHD